MKPQRPQRNALRTLKEDPFKDITEKIISCAIKVIKSIHIAQVLTYLKVENLRVGLLINFNVYKLKAGIKKIIL